MFRRTPIELARTLFVVTLAVGCTSTSPRLAVDLRPRMNAMRADAGTLATLLQRGRIDDAFPPAERLARADFGAANDLPEAFHAHLSLFRQRTAILRQAANAKDLPTAKAAFDDVVASCTECHREFRAMESPIELSFEKP